MSKNDKNNLISVNMQYRAPVVTIMGHVDHGKTTLLDYILKTNIAEREYGGITQQVRAYQIQYDNKPITFIDTPGHEAFFAMRERGAKITDIVILVVAADDGVMPQTKEVISLLKKIRTHLIVAINKIDVPGANPEKVKRELATEGIMLEGYGGDIPYVEISAKHGTNVDKLLDLINLVAEINELYKFTDISSAEFTSECIVLESSVDKSLGPIATVIVKAGEVKRGEYAVGGSIYSRIRAIINDQNQTIESAIESMPVKIVGIPKVLELGEIVRTYVKENVARDISRQKSFNEQRQENKSKFSKADILSMLAADEAEEGVKQLNIVLIADTQGSIEAITHGLNKLEVEGVRLNIVEKRAGTVTINDVDMAKIRGAIILTFNTKVDYKVSKFAENSGVILREYNVIYEMLEEIELAMLGLVDADSSEEIVGEGNVLQIFQLSNGKFVLGVRVNKGKIIKGYNVYVVRKNEKVASGKIVSLRHNKDNVKEINTGMECGIMLEPNVELQTGDKVVCYRLIK